MPYRPQKLQSYFKFTIEWVLIVDKNVAFISFLYLNKDKKNILLALISRSIKIWQINRYNLGAFKIEWIKYTLHRCVCSIVTIHQVKINAQFFLIKKNIISYGVWGDVLNHIISYVQLCVNSSTCYYFGFL